MFIYLAKHESFKYLRQIRQDTNWPIGIFRIFLPFFETGFVLPCFRTDVNSELVIDVLKLECKKLAKMSAFSLMILEGISVSWHALETSRFKISLNISSSATSENEKAACFFFFAYFSYSEYAGMLFVFYNQFNNRTHFLSESLIGTLVTYPGILRLPTILKIRYSKLELCHHHLK